MSRLLLIIAALLTAAPALAQGAQDDAPEAVVERALKAHNAHDIDAFVATLAEDVKFLSLDGEVMVEGRDTVRDIWTQRFADYPDLRADIPNRHVIGNRVVDYELLRMHGDEGEAVELVAIYTVEDGLIQTMHVVQPKPDGGDAEQ